jgi:UDP-N-acetylmuramoylalanine--D-glutamate ligase
MELVGKRVVVLGLGASGIAAAQLARARGARVTGVDLKAPTSAPEGIELEIGPHLRSTFLSADLLIVSPGIPAGHPDVVAAEQAGVPVIGELGFAADLLGNLPMIGVTGTNGKSTVTSFTGQLLREAGFRAFVGGNLGDALSNAVPRDPNQPPAYDLAVVECSSYQLERASSFRPRGAVILNLTPDHLARHGTMEQYAKAKANIFRHQGPGDICLIPANDPLLQPAIVGVGQGFRGWLGALPGVVRLNNEVRVQLPRVEATFDLQGMTVPGSHNRDNAAVAAALALVAGASVAAIQAGLPKLVALAHRMEVVAEHNDVLWINDSKATNVDAALVGLLGIERPAIVLLGGQAKGPGFGALGPALARHRAVITFGEAGPQIAAELAAVGVQTLAASDMRDAMKRAAELVQPGEAVLLSPACASFDAFQNFEHRGRVFRALVEEVAP